MPTEPQPPTLSEVAQRAVEVCDPKGGDERLAEYVRSFEDRDEPVTAVADVQEHAGAAALRADPAGADPAVAMAAAVTTYLAFKREMIAADESDVLRLAARNEFDGNPPERLADWLRERGVEA